MGRPRQHESDSARAADWLKSQRRLSLAISKSHGEMLDRMLATKSFASAREFLERAIVASHDAMFGSEATKEILDRARSRIGVAPPKSREKS